MDYFASTVESLAKQASVSVLVRDPSLGLTSLVPRLTEPPTFSPATANHHVRCQGKPDPPFFNQAQLAGVVQRVLGPGLKLSGARADHYELGWPSLL